MIVSLLPTTWTGRPGRAARLLVAPALLAAAGPGCRLFQRSAPPVVVAVRDAETKAPISGAAVRLADPLARPDRALSDPAGTTAADGTVTLTSAHDSGAGVLAETSAPGYLFEAKEVPAAALEPAAEAGGSPVAVELYAAPRPVVELVVLPQFRGLIKAELAVRAPKFDDRPGVRQFAFEVPTSGTVELSGPPVLRHAIAPDYRARYADGRPLARDPGYAEIGFRWVRTAGHVQYFVVGTKEESDDARRSLDQQDAMPVRKTGGKSDGNPGPGGGFGAGSSSPNGIGARR